MHRTDRNTALKARCRRGVLALGLSLLTWTGLSCWQASAAPQGKGELQTEVRIDPRALAALDQVKQRMDSIRTLSAVCTYTQRHRKEASAPLKAYFELTTQLRLMRPNFTRIEVGRRVRDGNETQWTSVPQLLTEASDGQNSWTVAHADKVFDTEAVQKDGSNLHLYNLPLSGFFCASDFVTGQVEWFRQQGMLQSLTLITPSTPTEQGERIVRLMYRRDKTLFTDEYSIGADLLIHKIHSSVSTGDFDSTLVLSQLILDAPMTASSFVYHLPAGTSPRPPKQDAPEYTGPRIVKGMEAPDFTVQDAQGRAVKLSDFRGKWVVLDFWATWCGPCRESLPTLNAFARRKAKQNVVVLSVSVGDAPPTFQAWLAKHKEYDAIHFAVDPDGIKGNSINTRLYNNRGLPNMFVIDPKGKVRADSEAYDGDHKKMMAATIP